MKNAYRNWTGRLATFAIFSGLLLFAPSLARADEQVKIIRAKPPIGSTVTAPTQIDLWFNKPLNDRSNIVDVLPASALNVNLPATARVDLARGAPTLDPHDPTHLWVIVEPLPPGTYAVQWRVPFKDGHGSRGQFTFRVAG